MTESVEQKAAHARRLMGDPLLKECFDKIAGEAMQVIRDSQEADTLIREQAYYRIKTVDTVKEELQNFITDLKLLNR